MTNIRTTTYPDWPFTQPPSCNTLPSKYHPKETNMTFYVVAWGGLRDQAKHRIRLNTPDRLQRFIDKLAADPDIDTIIVHINRDQPTDPRQCHLPLCTSATPL